MAARRRQIRGHGVNGVKGCKGVYGLYTRGGKLGANVKGCRGLRPHHVPKDRIGSWEISGLTGAAVPRPARIRKARSRSR